MQLTGKVQLIFSVMKKNGKKSNALYVVDTYQTPPYFILQKTMLCNEYDADY